MTLVQGNPVKASGLYETDIEFVNTSFCKNAFVDEHNTSKFNTVLDFDIPRKFCVGTGESNAPFGCAEQGTGSGDEGGPLFKLPFPPENANAVSQSSSRPTLLGLFSSITPMIQNGNALGNRCNAVGRRSVFTRIAYYRGWIIETMITKDAGFCNPSQRYKSPLNCPAGEWGVALQVVNNAQKVDMVLHPIFTVPIVVVFVYPDIFVTLAQ